jgi:hypothetical protein
MMLRKRKGGREGEGDRERREAGSGEERRERERKEGKERGGEEARRERERKSEYECYLLFLCIFETSSPYVAHAGLELMILLPLPSEFWYHRCAGPHPAFVSYYKDTNPIISNPPS